eukprot:CAMPEP_0194481496 /NCGR_PEP_ID=MMETSP0253-20130528/3892_1 /TAXON_ID=2966 /ORGANISM="Noctiluca scintillans" /LENGTH=265 /DNA_ID=CAMNT_0039320985 /DNA_START=56 /DNA_END=853 /DNA_ORIENTATION=+
MSFLSPGFVEDDSDAVEKRTIARHIAHRWIELETWTSRVLSHPCLFLGELTTALVQAMPLALATAWAVYDELKERPLGLALVRLKTSEVRESGRARSAILAVCSVAGVGVGLVGLTRRQVTRCHVAQISPTAVSDATPQDTEVILQESLVPRYRSPSSSWLEAESPHERGTAAEVPILAKQSFSLTTCEAFSLDHADSPPSSPRGSEEGDMTASLHYLGVPGAVAETCVVHNMETPRDPVLAKKQTLDGCGQRHRPLEERAEDKR